MDGTSTALRLRELNRELSRLQEQVPDHADAYTLLQIERIEQEIDRLEASDDREYER